MADFLDTKIHTFWGKYINKQHPDHYYFCSASFGTWILKALFFTGVSVPQALQAQDSNPSPIPKWRLHQPFSPKHVYFHIPLTRRILGSVRNRTWETVQANKTPVPSSPKSSWGENIHITRQLHAYGMLLLSKQALLQLFLSQVQYIAIRP